MAVKHTEWLSDWELLALQEAMRRALECGPTETKRGEALLKKLESASHVRLSFMSVK